MSGRVMLVGKGGGGDKAPARQASGPARQRQSDRYHLSDEITYGLVWSWHSRPAASSYTGPCRTIIEVAKPAKYVGQKTALDVA